MIHVLCQMTATFNPHPQKWPALLVAQLRKTKHAAWRTTVSCLWQLRPGSAGKSHVTASEGKTETHGVLVADSLGLRKALTSQKRGRLAAVQNSGNLSLECGTNDSYALA